MIASINVHEVKRIAVIRSDAGSGVHYVKLHIETENQGRFEVTAFVDDETTAAFTGELIVPPPMAEEAA